MGSPASAGVAPQVGIQLLKLGFSRAELADPTELILGLGLGREKQLGRKRRVRTPFSVPFGMSNSLRRLQEELHLSLAFGLDSF